MTQHLKPVIALILSAAILLMGNGLLGLLGPIRADGAGFTRLDIGIMGSFHFAGLMAGCILWPRVVAKVGHIRAFAALTAMAAITPLCQAIWTTPVVWWGLRALNGLCFAGLFMVIETWLTGASTPETRGRVLGVYTMVNLTVVTVGMQLIGVGDPKSFELFSLVAILYALAAVPVALAPQTPPSPPREAKLRLGWLYSVSPAAVMGCFFTGIANSSFWSLSPLYAQGAGLSIKEAAVFVTSAVLGGAASQWPVGRLSDRLGRRAVAIVVCSVAALAGVLLFTMADKPPRALLLSLAALYGTMAFTVYTLCVAHANDLVHKKRAVEVSSGLLLTFSGGAILGPLAASYLMHIFGHGGLFLHSAIAHGAIAAVMLLRASQRPTLPIARREPFVPVPKTTPAVFDLDPRGEGEDKDAPTPIDAKLPPANVARPTPQPEGARP
ncbi:MAG TPA: MFS transporter [Hyphomicrobiaceae bacterium]|nr:MFS transporter [Hyphomicrobiaceae bacterium]